MFNEEREGEEKDGGGGGGGGGGGADRELDRQRVGGGCRQTKMRETERGELGQTDMDGGGGGGRHTKMRGGGADRQR